MYMMVSATYCIQNYREPKLAKKLSMYAWLSVATSSMPFSKDQLNKMPKIAKLCSVIGGLQSGLNFSSRYKIV